MKIAVTGASGHVGTNLCELLVQQGHHVRILVYRDRSVIEHLPVEFIDGDITNEEDLVALCRNCEVVIHLAANISLAEEGQKLHEN